MQREEERKAAVIRAEGDAESAKVFSEAISKYGQGLLEIRRIEAAKEIAGMLAKSPNITYLPGGQGTLLNLPVGK
jgi:prohibitin 1